MPQILRFIKIAVASFWRGLREWSGDAAYERYVECITRAGGKTRLTEAEFYVEQLNRKYSRPNRCC